MKAGLGSFAFRYAIGDPSLSPGERMDLKGFLECCNLLKIKIIQICDNIPLHQLSDEKLQDGKNLAEKYGIGIETGTAGCDLNHLTRHIEISRQFNSGILRTVLKRDKNRLSDDDTIDQICRLIPLLESNGIALAIENHFDHSPFELGVLIKKIDHPLVKICIDPLNSLTKLCGINETFNELKDYIITAHVKDVKIERKGTSFMISGCPLGEGLMGVEDYLKRIHVLNPDCNIFLEQWMDPLETSQKSIEKEMAWVKEGMSFLNNIIKNLKTPDIN